MDINNHLTADTADFNAFVAEQVAGRSPDVGDDLSRWLLAHPGRTAREWKNGTTPRLCHIAVDLGAPLRGAERAAYVRAQATTSLAHTLPLDIRREAARDAALVWNPLARRYRLKSPQEAHKSGAALTQPDRTADPLGSAPAPLERPDGAAASAFVAGQPDGAP